MYFITSMVIFLRSTGHYLPLMGLAIILGLSACALPSKPPPEKLSALAQAEALAAEGRYLAAAAEYIRLAAEAPPPQRQDYQLRAAAALLQGNQWQEAQELLEDIVPQSLEPALKLRYRLLAAQLAIAKRETKRALSLLKGIQALEPSLEQQATIHRLWAEAYELADNPLAAARERVQLEPLLSDAQALQENQRALWRTLMDLSPDTLKRLRKESLSNALRGWLELAQLFQRYQLNPLGLQQALDRWRERYPGHPASLALLQAEMSTLPTAPYQPTTIALLLPIKGRFAASAAAIRDGFFAAYYSDNSDWTPIIRFYGVKVDPKRSVSNAYKVYQQAQAEGADFVVGPLTKQSLAQLAEVGALPLPTLALNYLEKSHNPVESLYQLALSPEDEAQGVAERAWRDGHHNALALIPDTEWGQRVREVFTERWEELGGSLLEVQPYDPEKKDYSFLIQRLLNIDESQSRHRELREWLNRQLTFEPQRRHDADFVFLAAFPRQARLLIPQLQFYRAEDLPVYSSSHIYTGYPDPERDLDLDNVIFSDIPWVLNDSMEDDPSYQSLAAVYPENFERLKRLYALGSDAYRIIPHLNALHQVQDMTFEGATGRLRMDAEQRLRRELNWAQFKKGRPQPTIKPAP
ncbi:penicillin-binding protein activator [Nitrosococcus wardiae]|uniref:Penicillin-binding protein activator n=2 Tax=Nitrosococcus wardiae TaxID=1814290 RepID=A0A4P7C1F5_9GAMM|nr:penicillin-binding protein activator [Nitrosococcus wardiae]